MSILTNRLLYILSPQFDIYEQVAKIVKKKVADIGCGTGFGTHLLSRNARKVWGYDIDPDMVRFASRAFTYKNLIFNEGNVLDGIPGQYDFITMIDVIEHIKQDELAIEKIVDMLLPGGTFICSTPNRLSRYRKSANHIREYSPDELRELIFKHFEDISICRYDLEPSLSEYDNPIIAIANKEAI